MKTLILLACAVCTLSACSMGSAGALHLERIAMGFGNDPVPAIIPARFAEPGEPANE